MQGLSLSDAYCAAARSTPDGSGSHRADGLPPALEAALKEYVHAARSAWPDLVFDDVEFVGYVGARADAARPPPHTHAGELLLTYACSRGVSAALAAFHRDYGPVIDRVLMHRKAAHHIADDARQIVQQRLLVGDGETGSSPKIATYRGTGPLKSWVASAAATTLLMLYRTANRRREQPEDSAASSLGSQLEPELAYLKERYKGDVEHAIIDALEALGARDKTLLRLHLGERLNIDAIAAIYTVNRATAARWLAAARQSLMASSRERLRANLRLSDSECDSLVALVNSQIDVSIARRLSEA